MRVLDLFSGIGGFSLGLHWAGMRTVALCESDPFARRVLARAGRGRLLGRVRRVGLDGQRERAVGRAVAGQRRPLLGGVLRAGLEGGLAHDSS